MPREPFNERCVAIGPVPGTWWCTLDDAPHELTAPGGVVLTWEGTLQPHTDAARAAESAWALLRSWQAHLPTKEQL